MGQEAEKHLAYLGLKIFNPSPELSPYIRCYWAIGGDDTYLTTPHQEFLHPAGSFGLIFNLSDSLKIDGKPLANGTLFDGTNTVSRRLTFMGKVAALGVCFQAGGAYPFFETPLHQMTNAVAITNATDQAFAQKLYAILKQGHWLEDAIERLEALFFGQLRRHEEAASVVPYSLEKIRESAGQLSIQDMLDDLAIGQRQLERLYKTQVGITPKHYARLMRVQESRLSLRQRLTTSLAELSADVGFYDQSHFVREFKSIIGLTPHQYHRYSLHRYGKPPTDR